MSTSFIFQLMFIGFFLMFAWILFYQIIDFYWDDWS